MASVDASGTLMSGEVATFFPPRFVLSKLPVMEVRQKRGGTDDGAFPTVVLHCMRCVCMWVYLERSRIWRSPYFMETDLQGEEEEMLSFVAGVSTQLKCVGHGKLRR